MNLYQKIIEVRKSIGKLSKDKEGYQFSYVTGDQILHKIKDKMNELQLILQPSTQSGEWARHDYVNSKGKEKIDFLVWGQGSYTWINAENPEEREVVPFAYFGQQGDDMSQAYGTALTYAERYFLLKYFGLPTDEDDPDYRRNKPPTSNQNKSKGQTTGDKPKVTTQMLIDAAKSHGVTTEQLLATYKKETNKSTDDVKFISQEKKQEYYNRLQKA